MFFLKDSIFEEPRTRNAPKMHRRQFCYMSIVFGGPPEILPMKSSLYVFFIFISFSLVATFQKCLRSSAFSLG